MEIFLIRHTSVQISKSVCYGQSDIDVADTFETEAQLVQEKLPKNGNLAVICSPLQRCIRLAARLCSVYATDARLMEVNFGDWEQKNWSQIPENELSIWMNDFVNCRPANGESFLELHQRVGHFLADLQKKSLDQVFIVTHAGVIRSLLCHILQIPLTHAFRLQIDYGSVSHVSIQDQLPIVTYINR